MAMARTKPSVAGGGARQGRWPPQFGGSGLGDNSISFYTHDLDLDVEAEKAE